MKSRKRINAINLWMLLVGGVLLTLGLVRLGAERQHAGRIAQQAQQLSATMESQPSDAPVQTMENNASVQALEQLGDQAGELGDQPVLRSSMQSLLNQNPDAVGWLHIGDVLDLPVVQRGQTYYVTHGFDQSESNAGALFMDEANCLWPEDQHYMIYGHNMASGAMFGHLPRYTSPAFWQQHKNLFLETLYGGTAYYIISAVCLVSTSPESDHYASIRGYRNFDTDQDFASFMEQVNRTRLYATGVPMSASDEYLSLVTCYGDSDERLVVLARKLREDGN